MKKLLKDRRLQAVAIAVLCAFSGPVLSESEAGTAAFTTEGHKYLGRYTMADHALSVDIDGLLYRGHYAAHATAGGARPVSETKDGQWGSAFLFASSAEVLQCQLDAGFPQVKGRCQGADGRKFDLGPTLKP